MNQDNATQLEQIPQHLSEVHARIAAACKRSGRSTEEVALVSVTKHRPLEALRLLHQLGETSFAENRVQDARDRIPQVPGPIEWHFIGHLQTNKAKYLPGLFQWVQSVDKIAVAEALNRAWEKAPNLPPVNILLQFNIAEEEQKHGSDQSNAEEFLRAALALPRVKVCGLMCMAPYGDDPELSRPVFKQLRQLRDHLVAQSNTPLPHLSMGMTNDFEVAIEEGATMVRVGTALFEGF